MHLPNKIVLQNKNIENINEINALKKLDSLLNKFTN
jgi:hypothetical protein